MWDAPTYSASKVRSAMVAFIFADKCIGGPNDTCSVPVDDFLSVELANSESQYVCRWCDDL